MATSKVKSNRITLGLNGQYAGIGRADGDIAITIPVPTEYASYSFDMTTGISADVYGDKSFGNVTCDINTGYTNMSYGRLYLRLTPRTSYSSYISTGKPGVFAIQTQMHVTLS